MALDPPATITDFSYEVDPYSTVDGAPTSDFDLAGGSVVLTGSREGTTVRVTMSGASLPTATGHALGLLLSEEPATGVAEVRITAYVDGENGRVMTVDREVVAQ
ncbi:MAG: hypothetical protein ACR2F6_10605 [Mycobacteriales bacterium]